VRPRRVGKKTGKTWPNTDRTSWYNARCHIAVNVEGAQVEEGPERQPEEDPSKTRKAENFRSLRRRRCHGTSCRGFPGPARAGLAIEERVMSNISRWHAAARKA